MLKDFMRKKLREQGSRVTAQREAILKIFEEYGDHLGADDVYNLLLKRKKPISKSTVYRTLELLTGIGILRKLEFNGGVYRYELSEPSSNHHHAVCTRCGKIIDLKFEEVSELFKKAEKMGFFVNNYSIILYGLCPSCQENEMKSITEKMDNDESR